MGQAPTPTVTVAVATYRRPAGLAAVLPALVGQATQLRDAVGQVVVVDNDPDGGAEHQVSVMGLPGVLYVHEARPGIAAARNCAIDVSADADALVFIDDDEVPQPGWLQSLVDAWRAWGCAAVTGPVVFELAGQFADDPWLAATGLFTRVRRVSGVANPGASSANLLLDLGVLRALGIRFDEQFGLSGGSDTMLAHTLRQRGELIRWCDEAVVTESVPASRSTRRWAFMRTMRTSNSWSRVQLALAQTPTDRTRWVAELTARGGVRLARGLAARAVGALRGDVSRAAAGTIDMASGLGLVLGAYGHIRVEYGRQAPTGSDVT